MATPEAAQPAVAAVLHNAADQLNVDESQLNVLHVESRDWPDRALGCPRPGVMYAQIVTPGYVVLVGGPGQQLEYHTDQTGQLVVRCEPP